MTRKTRPGSWSRAARKEFEAFPAGTRTVCLTALTIAAEGGWFEIALADRGDAFRGCVRGELAEGIRVAPALQKKSRQGNKAPKREIDLVIDDLMQERVKRLKEMMR